MLITVPEHVAKRHDFVHYDVLIRSWLNLWSTVHKIPRDRLDSIEGQTEIREKIRIHARMITGGNWPLQVNDHAKRIEEKIFGVAWNKDKVSERISDCTKWITENEFQVEMRGGGTE